MKKTTLLMCLIALFTGYQALSQITSYPYSEDFESGDGGWTADNTNSGTWALGTPASAVINSAASGANSWVTNLTGNYNNGESSFVNSPIFDLTSLTNPSIEFSVWWESEFSWDGTVLQSSIDGGATWQNVGAVGDPNNWYTDGTINGNPGGQQEGWTGRNGSGSNGWVTARHALVGLAGQSSVQFRIAFGSDGSVQDEGFAFDDVSIFDVTCPEPLNLTATTTGDSTADIFWSLGGSESDWQIWVQPAGTGLPTTDGTVTSNNNPYPASGLTPSTAYEVYVRANCNANGYSNWVGPVNFTTFNVPPPAPVGVTCSSGSSTFIFTEDFGNDTNYVPTGWTGTTFADSNGNWDITIPSSNSTGTGPDVTWDGNAGTHLEYEASGNTTNVASAITPAIDLSTAVDGAELSFYMHAYGVDMGTLNVGVSTSATGPFTTEYTWIGEYQTSASDPWVPIGINLDAYLGQVIYIEFSYVGTGATWEGDMSIDQVRVETCGNFCVAPSNITIAGITHDSADISWTPSGSESQWNYVVQPAGTGVPTSGTTVGTTTLTESGLSPLTDYEVYVQAICGANTSVWAGPISFSTTAQTNFVLDCTNGGPQNLVYCYENNDTNVFTFTSSDGTTPLNITFNAGQVEQNWDELIVLDSDGITDLNAATPYGNNGDVSGITYQSTGSSISFQVQSDGSVNCQGNGYTSIDVTVSCATCINPTATFAIVDDCANGDQFLVDVNITSLGDATSLSVQDNQGNSPVSVSTTGSVTPLFGPYPFNTDIIFTISNEQDGNCVITSQAISLAGCPPDNDNPCDATTAVVNDAFLCEVSTPGTLLEATSSGVPNPSCGGDPDDDVWYQFTATSDFHLISLANVQGSNTGDIDFALYEGACDALVEIDCTSGFALLSSITPQLVVGNTYFIRIFSGSSNSETTTFDLCITPYEAPTNVTCDATENLCPGGDDLYTFNTVGVEPGLGQIDCLFTSPNPTFSVLEIGTSGTIEVQMVQNTAFDAAGNPIGDELDVDFALWGPYAPGDDYCSGGDYPSDPVTACSYSAAPVESFTINNAIAGEIYIVMITNFEKEPGVIQITQTNLDPNNPDPNAGTLSADIDVELSSVDVTFIDNDNDDTTPMVAEPCGLDSITIEADSPFADTFEWYINNIFQPNLTSSSITVSESGPVTVYAYDNQCMGVADATVIVNLYKDPIVNVVPPEEVSIVTCDDESGDGVEEFDFSTLSSIILDDVSQDPNDFVVTYHETLSDAQSGTNAITFPYSAVDGTVIYVRAEDVNAVGSGSGCASTNTSFTLTVLGALPEITDISDFIVCDDSLNDGYETFDLSTKDDEVLNGQDSSEFSVSYHVSELDAETNSNPITAPFTNTEVSSQTIYVRLENLTASDCYKTSSFEIIVNPLPETTFGDVVYEVCPNATVPITVTAIPDNYTSSEVSVVWYDQYDTVISGATSLDLDTVLTAGVYTIEVTFTDTGCSNTAEVLVEELESCVIPQGISPGLKDGKNDTFDLSSFDVQRLEIYNRYGTLVYSKDNYINEWHGQSNNGDELPVGTYYYIMKYQGSKQKAAWIYINR
ncbi:MULTISPECIES: T9SS type B sorting domain-containing protein [Mesoflavibacter]|uniref:T9SS type B sorting domain-containing protein n=1 Tax=Mesoflavibacter TaxID=444051 RepID=UPI0013F45017|nr:MULTISPECIES: gliding motility-associated C-terminal domain-containing protein [Mesoflavibacter]